MITKNFKIDFEEKNICYIGKASMIYTAHELYSFLMDLFDEPENLKYDIPIVAKSKNDFQLINGWEIDEESLKHIKGKIIQTP
jgi:hypothetical protein